MSSTADRVPLGLAHVPLRDQVRDEVRQRISDGRLVPGAKVIERELATELGVSRVPVREALRTLETEGFVQVVPRRGVIIRPLSREDVEELFDVREALEALACREASVRADAGELSGVQAILTKGSEALESGDRDVALWSNEAFHDAVIKLAHNELLAAILEPLEGRLHWLFRQTDDIEAVVRQHLDLFEAIASGSPELAGRAAVEHVRLNRETALRLLYGSDW